MTVKLLLIMCMVLALVNDKGCRSSVETAKELAERFPEPSAVEQAELDEILSKWEQNTAAFDRFRSRFRRWEYDPVFGPKDTFKTYSEGLIHIARPDQWYFCVDKVRKYRAPRQAGESPSYSTTDPWDNEEWSWDGEWLTQADFTSKRVVRTQLSPQPEPVLCPEFPSPWMGRDTEPVGSLVFGEPFRWLGKINIQDLKQRYRMRLLPPTENGHDNVIQAIPRTPSALFFNPLFTTIYLDHESCLPQAVILHWSATAAPNEQQPRAVYQLDKADGCVAEGEDSVVPQVEVREGWVVEENPYIAFRANNP